MAGQGWLVIPKLEESNPPGLTEVGGWRQPLVGKCPGIWLLSPGMGRIPRTGGGGQPTGAPEEGKAKVRLCLCPLPDKSTRPVLQALTFIIFICFTASISAYMAAALLEFFITLAFLFLYATEYYQRFDRLNWPCLVRNPASSTPFFLTQSFPFFCQPLSSS